MLIKIRQIQIMGSKMKKTPAQLILEVAEY